MSRRHHHGPDDRPQGSGPAPQLTLADLPPRPYSYRGRDFTIPVLVTVRRGGRPVPGRRGSPFTDPGRRGSPFTDPGWPDVFSAPPEWHRELAEAAAEEAS